MPSALCVFPACAGMFRYGNQVHEPSRRFPRVRGDVPPPANHGGGFGMVFPACAGMFL